MKLCSGEARLRAFMCCTVQDVWIGQESTGIVLSLLNPSCLVRSVFASSKCIFFFDVPEHICIPEHLIGLRGAAGKCGAKVSFI